jgi:hypothetical protein
MKKRYFVNFNSHSALANKHALLSPSQYSWINYDEQKLEARFHSSRAAARGSALHDLAHNAIQLGIKLSNTNKSLARYVNDAIRYNMTSEQPLYYSDNCFGHADAISFRRGKLRIHDLKTGLGRTSVHQLEVYAALFCLEYDVDPYSIDMEFRIYQFDEPDIFDGDPDIVSDIMQTIIEFDMRIEFLKERELR